MAKITVDEERALAKEFNECRRAARQKLAALEKRYPDFRKRLIQIIEQRRLPALGRDWFTMQDVQDAVALMEEIEITLKKNSPQSN